MYMKFWGGGRNKPLTVDQFEQKHDAQRGLGRPAPEHVEPLRFRMSREAYDWVHYEAVLVTKEHSIEDMYDAALLLAAFLRLAREERFVPFLTAQGGAGAERHGLPPLPDTGP